MTKNVMIFLAFVLVFADVANGQVYRPDNDGDGNNRQPIIIGTKFQPRPDERTSRQPQGGETSTGATSGSTGTVIAAWPVMREAGEKSTAMMGRYFYRNLNATSETPPIPPQLKRNSTNSTAEDQQYMWESKLLHELFITRQYNNQATPAQYRNKPVEISLELHVLKIDELIEVSQEIVLSGFLKINWTDPRLMWETTKFGELDWIVCSAHLVWLPDLGLINSHDVYSVTRDSRFPVTLANNGRLLFVPAGKIRARCELQLKFYPFDVQTCVLRFESWMYPASVINIVGTALAVEHLHFTSNPQWFVTNSSTLNRNVNYEGYIFSRVDFAIMLERKALFLIVYTIFPCIALSILQICSHILPFSETERITFATTALMSFAIFHISIVEQMPKSSDSLPLLALYVDSLMCLIAFSLIECFLLIHWISKVQGTFTVPSPFFWWLVVQRFGKFTGLGPVGEYWQCRYLEVYEQTLIKAGHDMQLAQAAQLFLKKQQIHNSLLKSNNQKISFGKKFIFGNYCCSPFEEFYLRKIFDRWNFNNLSEATADGAATTTGESMSSVVIGDSSDQSPPAYQQAYQALASHIQQHRHPRKIRRRHRRSRDKSHLDAAVDGHCSSISAQRVASPATPFSPLYSFQRRPMMTAAGNNNNLQPPSLPTQTIRQQEQLMTASSNAPSTISTIVSPVPPIGQGDANACSLCGGQCRNAGGHDRLIRHFAGILRQQQHAECLQFNEWRHGAGHRNGSVELSIDSLCQSDCLHSKCNCPPNSNNNYTHNLPLISQSVPENRETTSESKEKSGRSGSSDNNNNNNSTNKDHLDLSESANALKEMTRLIGQIDKRNWRADLRRDCTSIWTIFITVIDRFITFWLVMMSLTSPLYVFVIHPRIALDDHELGSDPLLGTDAGRSSDLYFE